MKPKRTPKPVAKSKAPAPLKLEYRVLASGSGGGLMSEVGLYLKNGWQPLGGVALGSGLFAQAMIRPYR